MMYRNQEVGQGAELRADVCYCASDQVLASCEVLLLGCA